MNEPADASPCEFVPACKFFNDQLPNMPQYAELLKDMCRREDDPSCARFQVFLALGIESVPPDHYPKEPHRVREILEEGAP